MKEKFDICMIGLGPVGTVSGLCFAQQGFRVIGVDSNPQRVKSFDSNTAPFVEPAVNTLVAQMRKADVFHTTTDFAHAVRISKIIMVAVGTPATVGSGKPDFTALDAVAEALGRHMSKGSIIVLRSTVPPGTLRYRLAPIIEQFSGMKAGHDFYIAANPEFLREGHAIEDFFDAGRVVIGADDEHVFAAIAGLYPDVKGERLHTSIESAEFAKYVDNSWHAVKVAFANEIGRTAAAVGCDVQETAKIFLADRKLNLSAKYLQPGFAFGGSCLPKDVQGLNWLAQAHDVNLPVMQAIMPSNDEQIKRGVDTIVASGARRVGLLGLAFKEGIDDLRESPILYVAQALKAIGIEVYGCEKWLEAGAFIALPGGERLVNSPLEEVLQKAEVLVKFRSLASYDIPANVRLPIIDLTEAVYQFNRLPEQRIKATG